MRVAASIAVVVLQLGCPLAASAQPAIGRSPLPDSVERQILYGAGTHVLAIGISEYADHGAWPRLHGARDAGRVAQLFRERGVPPSLITLFTPKPGDAKTIDDALLDFGASLPPESESRTRVVVYFAGHGYTEGGRGYLVPPEAPDPAKNARDFKAREIPLAKVLTRLAEFQATHVLLIVDACFSGGALRSLAREKFPRPPRALDAHQRVLQVITAGTANQPVADDGLFADLIVAGLTGAADLNLDGWITGTELGMYLRLRMTEQTGRRQTPTFGNVVELGPDFVEGENWFASAQQPSQVLARPLEGATSVGRAFRDCAECPLMTVVPGPGSEAGRVDAPYLAMGVFEVTFEEFDACFRANACLHWPVAVNGNRGRLPVTDVSREDVAAYTHWLSCLTNASYRLPADAEWLNVAAPEARRFQRQATAGGPALGNCRGCGSPWDSREVAPVGSFEASDLGLFDLIGNVWEWVADCATAPGHERVCATGRVRGGGFTTRRSVAIMLPDGSLPATTRDRNIGFRVARDLETAATALPAGCSDAASNR